MKNRDIKFRAWQIEEKRMCEVDLVNIKQGAFLLGAKKGEDQITDGGKTYVPAPTNGRFCYWHEIKLMQFTGLKDKNGKEIYEGDIVLVSGYSRGMSYDDEGFEYTLRGYVKYAPSKGFYLRITQRCDTDNDIEIKAKNKTGYITQSASIILGNTHEHPQLLTQ